MNAAVVQTFERAPRYDFFADPVAAEGEKLVAVTAAGLHPVVKALANGTHYAKTGELPFIPGVDGVGRLADGTRVYFGVARSPFGSFAQRTLAASWMCIPLPDGVDDATAAGIANPAMSSWLALTSRAKFAVGESVLVLGATGAAGQLAVQIAKRMGARRVIAVGRNRDVLDRLTDLGADAVISMEREPGQIVSAIHGEWTRGGVDVVLDYLWGQPAEGVLEALSGKGARKAVSRVRFVQIGESAGRTISLPAAVLRSSGIELIGSGLGSVSLSQIGGALTEFFQMATRDEFQFDVKTAPLKDVEALWNSGDHGARLVLRP